MIPYKEKEFAELPYDKQLTIKQAYVQSMFLKLGFDELDPILKNPQPKYYRHKVVVSALAQKERLVLGLYEEGSKRIIPGMDYIVHDRDIQKVLTFIEPLLNRYKIQAYDPKRKIGILKHVYLRKSYQENTILICFVTNGYILPNHKKMIQEIVQAFPHVKSVVQNIQNKDSKFVILENEKVLYGPGYIIDYIDHYPFRITAQTFYQVNPIQMINLYRKAIELAKLSKDDVVLDAYSGIGTIAMIMEKHVKKVIALESNKVSYLQAKETKKISKADHVVLVHGDVSQTIHTIQDPIDVVVMDPPREGSSQLFLDTVLGLKPKKIIYISCEVETLVRDLKILQKGYHIRSVQPVDMFSYTTHVENIVLLSLK